MEYEVITIDKRAAFPTLAEAVDAAIIIHNAENGIHIHTEVQICGSTIWNSIHLELAAAGLVIKTDDEIHRITEKGRRWHRALLSLATES